MQPDEPASRTLESLPPRPPTPPRDSQQSTNRPSLFNRIFSKSLGAQTPPNLSPGSAAAAASSPSERANRRVAWSASTDYRDHEEPPKNPNAINPKLRLIPSSADRQQPQKSILKQNNGDAVNRHIDFHIQPNAHTPETFATMLESVTKQLAGDDRLSRIDAYMSLSDVLKATEQIPGEEALRNKMGLLAQFMRRDILAQTAEGEVDKVLVNNALTLLASLLWKNEQFPQEFAIFVLEHTIISFERATVPKDVVKHLMFIIGQQNFSPKIVTTDRATRLLHSTYLIQEKYTGKSIALGRLSVYKKLLQQAKAMMIAPPNTLWLKHVFEDMLNPVKNVRAPVLSFGFEAALQLGTEKHGSRAFTELFESPYDETSKYADYYHGRLLRMLQSRGENASLENAAVPRIWSIMIIFLRYKPAQLDKWEFWPSYLHVLQKCFNSSDPEAKAQANLAWNRLVFALQPDDNAEKRRLNRQLLQPFLGQLHAKRKSTGKNSKEAFQITVSSACNLLYYALRPSASHTSLDLLWDLYVPPLIQQLSDTDSAEDSQNGTATCEGSNQAIAILHALLNPTPRAKQPWRVDRAMSDERMRFNELSPIDPKWVRSNSQRVLAVLQPLLKRRFKDLSADQSRLKDLWKGYLLSIAAAAAKEVITSHETMACIAHTYTMAHAFWQQRPCHDIITQEGQSTAFLDSFVYLLTEMVKVLGMLPFSEKRLSVEDLNPFAIVATPSTGSRKAPKAAKTAVQCLVSVLVAPGPNIEANFAVKGALRRLLLPFYEFRAKNKTTVEFLQELFQTLPTIETASEVNRGAVEAVWCVLAKFMCDTLEYSYPKASSDGSSNSTPNSQLLGVAFRDKVRVLEYGLVYISYDGLEEWQSLYSQTSYSISQEVGIGGRALAVIEPLAHSLLDLYRPEEARSFVSLFGSVIQDAQYPATEQSLEAARRRLWGVSSTSTRQSIDPYKQLYRAINFFLEKSYDLEGASQAVADMVEHTGAFIRQCPHALHEVQLQTLSNSVALWLRDPEDVTSTADSDSLKASINDLWDDIQDSIDTRPGHNDLGKLKTILAAALESRHKYIVSRAIELWNQRFGVLENIEYPDEVAKALARLRSSANLLLPNFPDIVDSEAPPATINFLESDDSDPMEYTGGPRFRSVTPSILGSSPVKARSSPAITLGLPRSVMSSAMNHQHLELPSANKRKPAKQDTPRRLRHDNSQIKFAAIEHTSEPADSETQLLTDHQKEIKERQEEENRAMFADLRSSPKPKAKKSEKKRLSLTSDRPVSQAAEQEQPATPSVTSAVRTLDDWVTSSPTPQNRKQKHVVVEDDIAEVEEQAPVDIPSSPPKARSLSPPPVAQARTPSPKTKSPAADVEMEVAQPKFTEVPVLHPPGPSNVDSPPSFANLVDHLAAESVTNSSPAAASASLSQLTKTTSKRRRSPVKLSPRTTSAEEDEDEDEDEIMEEAPAVALVTPSGVVFDDPPSPAPAQSETATSAPPSTKPKKRGRPKTSRSGRKSTEHQAESATITSEPVPPVEGERRRSSSLSELDESMVKSLEQHHVPYVSLKPNADFSPEQYEKVEVFSSPQREAEPEQPRKETRILPPAKATGKAKTARKSDVKATPEPATVKTRAADKRQSMTPTVETPLPTPQRASSRLRHVEPEVVDLEKADPSLSRSGRKLSRSERQKAFAESMKKTPTSRLKDVEVVEETPAPSEAPKKSHKKKEKEKVAEAPVEEAPATSETPKRSSHKKKAAESEKEVAATPSVMETWLRKDTPIPVPSRKRKPSDQVEPEPQPIGPPGQFAILEATAKSSRDRKRRKKDERRLQTQVVEDSQQKEPMDVDHEHEDITVPPLSAVPERLEKAEEDNDTSSETYKTAKSASATGAQTPSKVRVSVEAAQRKKKSKSGKNGKGLSAADRSVVDSSQAEGDSKPTSMEEDFDNMIASLITGHEEFEQALPKSQRSTRKTSMGKERKNATGFRAADRSVVESSQREEDERPELTKESLDQVMGGVESEAVSEKGDAEDDAISIVSSHLEVSQTEETTTVKYFDRSGKLQREVTKSKSPEPAQTPAAKDPDTDMDEADVEAQPRSSIVSKSQLGPSTPPRAMATSSSQKSSMPQQEQYVIPSSPPPGGQQRIVQTSSEYISSSLPSDAVEPGKSSSKPSSGEQSFTSSPPHRAQQSVEEEDHRRFAESVADQPKAQQLALEEGQPKLAEPQPQPKVSSSSAASASSKEEELSYENIAAVFAQGIEMLNRCNSGIRRHHVAKMEEMVFDIKGAMYNAERRSREQMTEQERIREFGRFD